MKKVTTFTSFAAASILVILTFVTAKSYIQLIIAVALYPILMYFIYRLIMKGEGKVAGFAQANVSPGAVMNSTASIPSMPIAQATVTSTKPISSGNEPQRAEVEVKDIDKRTFLKIVGAAGLSFFVFSLLGRRVESLILGRATDSGIIPTPSDEGGQKASSTEGYIISEIDDLNPNSTFYGFVNKEGAWFIMKEDSETSSYRYTKGDSDFTVRWRNRENLDYDYYYNLF